MALKSTIYKAALNVADLDRSHFGDYPLTLARHPSETDERLMVRVLAFALHADERLEFGKGISTDDEPALWLRDYGGEIRLWIEVGLPDEKLLRRAAGRAERLAVLAYGGRAVDVWWAKQGPAVARLDNLTVLAVSGEESAGLEALASRNMQLQCTVQDGHVWLAAGEATLQITPKVLKAPA